MKKTLNDLLNDFNSIQKKDRNLTIMQVSGYSHYENVCSNILGFFLDPEEDHGLGDLLLKSLLPLYSDNHNLVDFSSLNTTVEREYITDKNQRIDLLLTSDTHIIAIENKIYHTLNNDLQHYSDTVEDLAREGNLKQTKFVLSTKLYSSVLPGDFKSITYLDLWNAVEPELDRNPNSLQSKWGTFLLDFIQTTKDLSSGFIMDFSEQDQFFIKNWEQVNCLKKAEKEFYRKLQNRVDKLFQELKCSLDTNAKKQLIFLKELWIHRKYCIVFDFELFGQQIALDLKLHPACWELAIFERDNKGCAIPGSRIALDLYNQLVINGDSKHTNSGHLLIRTWDSQTELNILLSDTLKLVENLSAHMKKLPSR